MAREAIDLLESRWYEGAAPTTCAELLPDHPWLGLPGSDVLELGSPWVICADLMMRREGGWLSFRRSNVAPCGLATMARLRGSSIPTAEISRYRDVAGRLEVIPAGTPARLSRVSGSFDAWHGLAATSIAFVLPDGRTMTLNTRENWELDRTWNTAWEESLPWWNLACAAAVVPTTHPYARDGALLSDALARIDAAASAASAETSGHGAR